MMRKKIIFCGTPLIGRKCLEAIFNKEKYEIIFVISQPDKLIGRKKEIIFSPVKNFCLEHQIQLYQPEKISELKEVIANAQPDLILTCAYGQFIPSSILEIPQYKCINVHASLLPKYRGGAPIHWALINGEKETGITLMFMEKVMDAGAIIYQEKIAIEANDNLLTLFNKMENLAYQVVNQKIDDLFNEQLKSWEQDLNQVTFGYNIKREDERIDWNWDVCKIYNRIRGLAYNPTSFSTIADKIIKIYQAEITSSQTKKLPPGTIIDVNKKGILVATKNEDLLITEIQFEGKKMIKGNDIYNNRLKLINQRFI
ncbi:MAG: methionyl-tRNA formyltransferase [Mycoplasmoidaceae bacterium]